ncbi:PREDICTED: uncharacterized protein LOC107327747 isoform X1 [Acropora digitifera]|uniref:uncharacterized protein LOC107327747 isoform X1 n=1 Tax=Acropora digitifera TaxID=70779 RepID=UPI00077A830D|nr:PREDICTED: uncharacterized protein LOC107327747 isoform X1 [Acropora digitifera]
MRFNPTILYIGVGFCIFIEFTCQQALIQRSEHQHHGYFEVFLNHSLNVSPILSTISVSRYIQCAFSCLQNVLCFSFNVATLQDINSKQYACQLLPTDKCRNPDDFVLSQEFHHYATPNPCETSPRKKGTRSPLNHKEGQCADGSFGRSCHPKGTDQ